ncbi:MAG: acyl carrier protein [Nocardioides sp.]|uniref:acyl carrier protein n=1 Tax=Nocardioides sp. TaxID=35761 RepID=UPI0023950016|nr:acyl carrier protein [Nocardioides sp.]MDE0775681.1 acyl carrier protein [Nocardioides sp.]
MQVTEDQVSQVWATVIGIDVAEVDVDVNFFDLGGKSLQLVQLVDELRSTLGVDTNVVTLLEYSTIEEFTVHCNDGHPVGS